NNVRLFLQAERNCGCRSSQVNAVRGLLQFGIRAIVASSFGEIFYSNAMNNRLLLVMVSEDDVQALMQDTARAQQGELSIDLKSMTVRSAAREITFALSRRHRDMVLPGQYINGAALVHREAINAFAAQHWERQPWLKNVAA